MLEYLKVSWLKNTQDIKPSFHANISWNDQNELPLEGL